MLGSGLLILSLLSPVEVYGKAGLLARTFLLISSWVWTLWVCWLGHWCCRLVKGHLRFEGARSRGGSAVVGPLACAAQAPVHSPPGVTGDTCDGPAVKDTLVNMLWMLWDLSDLQIRKTVCAKWEIR